MSEPETRALQPLLDALAHEDPIVRAKSLKRLAHLLEAPAEVLAQIARHVQDPDPMVRALAADALGHQGPAAHAQVPALCEALGRAAAPVRFWIARALGRIGVDTPQVRAALQETAEAAEEPAARAAAAAAKRALRTLSGSPQGGSEA